MRRILPVVALALACVPAVAAAQPRATPRGGAAAGQAAQPAATREPSAYQQAVQNGVRLMLARDFDGAITALRQGVQAEPSNPEAFYFIAEAQRMKGDLTEAVEAFRTALRMAQQANHNRFQSRALQGIADTLERIDGRMADAREAWTQYSTFADTHRDVAFPEIGRSRIEAIDAAAEQERLYVDVRQRIHDREEANAHPPARGGSRPAR